MHYLALASGDRMPALGLGTWKADPGEVGAAVEEAIKLGYRHIDCAAIYANEAEIGEALARCFDAGLVTREELWVTSKLWNDCHAPEHVGPALARTLADLRLDYLDLYLVHWPVALRHGKLLPEQPEDFIPLAELPLAATWAAMEDVAAEGLARNIGVSNFSIAKIDDLDAVARVRPAVNQVELHPYLQQPELLDACEQLGIVVTAYSPLGSSDRPPRLREADEPRLLADPVIGGIAEARGVSPAQVLLAWAIARGTAVIPKSTNPGRLAENLAAAELSLSKAELAAIAGLDRQRRYISGSFWAMDGGPYTLADLWG
jgi:alcohol dehydrogenase (NADP+)